MILISRSAESRDYISGNPSPALKYSSVARFDRHKLGRSLLTLARSTVEPEGIITSEDRPADQQLAIYG